MQNNANRNSSAVVLTENEMTSQELLKKDGNPQNVREDACPASTWWFGHQSFLGRPPNTVCRFLQNTIFPKLQNAGFAVRLNFGFNCKTWP